MLRPKLPISSNLVSYYQISAALFISLYAMGWPPMISDLHLCANALVLTFTLAMPSEQGVHMHMHAHAHAMSWQHGT